MFLLFFNLPVAGLGWAGQGSPRLSFILKIELVASQQRGDWPRLARRSVTPVVVVMTGSIPCWVSSSGRTIILALWKKYLED